MPAQSLSVRGLNHVSRVCKDVEATAAFYRDILGFLDVRRPRFDFEGAWLYSPNCSVGVHLIKGQPLERSSVINPKADHLSFVCTNLAEVEALLKSHAVDYVKQAVIEEDGVRVTQVFFHDPENNMIEICNCDELPVILAESGEVACAACQLQQQQHWDMLPSSSAAHAIDHEDGSDSMSVADTMSEKSSSFEALGSPAVAQQGHLLFSLPEDNSREVSMSVT